jgi:hypothetical protein
LGYLLIFLLVAGIGWIAFADRYRYNFLKKTGIKVSGVIIANKEHQSMDNDSYRLGGNINSPTVKFRTQNGSEIIGSPVIGFVTQYEVIPPLKCIVFYDQRDPDKFCVDFE